MDTPEDGSYHTRTTGWLPKIGGGLKGGGAYPKSTNNDEDTKKKKSAKSVKPLSRGQALANLGAKKLFSKKILRQETSMNDVKRETNENFVES